MMQPCQGGVCIIRISFESRNLIQILLNETKILYQQVQLKCFSRPGKWCIQSPQMVFSKQHIYMYCIILICAQDLHNNCSQGHYCSSVSCIKWFSRMLCQALNPMQSNETSSTFSVVPMFAEFPNDGIRVLITFFFLLILNRENVCRCSRLFIGDQEQEETTWCLPGLLWSSSWHLLRG